MNPIHPALAALAVAAKRNPARLAAALHAALRDPAWLRPEHRVGDPVGYMRHLLYVDPDGEFVVTAIVWLPGQQSAVHGHRVWCAFGVAEGELCEEQFSLDHTGKPLPRSSVTLRAGDAAELDLEGRGIHRVSNRSSAPMVSLHLYGVPADRLTTGINRIYA